MNPLSRLRELAARSTATVKEFGLLTKNEAAYDQDGHFTGIDNHYNGPGIAEAAGGAALVGAGLGAGHVGVMKKYGTETLRREKGRFITPKEVKVPVGQAYRKAGADVLAKIRSLAGKRFSAKDRLKELAAGPVAHAVFGTANVGAYNAPWGKKTEAYKDGFIHDSKHILGGALLGGAAGAGVGALVGKKGARRLPAVIGGLGGGLVGEYAGYIKGLRDPKAKEIRDRHLSSNHSLKELARGDRAIPAMKAILKANKEPQLHLIGTEGAAVPALRGNVSQVRRALNRFWGENASEKEAALHTKGIRGWAAGEIRSERALPKDLRAWAPKPSYKVKGNMLSAADRLKELAEKSVALKSFDQKVDENGHPILDTAVGAGLGAGAVLGHQAVMSNYGQNGAGIGTAYGAAAKDAKAGFQNTLNPPSTSEGSGMKATPATNSPLSHDSAKFSGTAPSMDAAPGVGGTAKVVEDSEEALKALKPGIAYRAGAAAGGLGSKIRGLLSGLRKIA